MDARALEPEAPGDTGDGEPADFGRLAEDYVFVQRLARGGLAVVDLARDRRSGRHVAIKRVRASFADDPETVARFAREAHIVAALEHPSIVRTLAVKRPDDHTLAIVMQYVPWPTLRSVLARAGPFSVERATRVLAEMGAALRYAHERGIVHRDVKPENIFLHERTARALLSDFGSARSIRGVDHTVTLNGSAIGTPTYMSPEQIDGLPVDGRSDLYSLGLVGWELLTGRRPWEGESLYRVLHNQKHEQLPPLATLRPSIPASLLFAVEGLLSKEPGARWPDADAFLTQLLREEPTVHPAAGPRAPDPSFPAALEDDGDDELDDAAWSPAAASDEHAPTVRVPTAAHSASAARRAAGRRTRRGVLVGTLVLAALATVVGTERRRGRDAAGRVRAIDSLVASMRAGELDDGAGAGGVPAVAPAGEDNDGDARARPGKEPSAPPASVGPARADSLARCESPALADQRACLFALLGEGDAALNQVYQRLIGRLRLRAGVPDRAPDPPAVRQLRAEQRAWVASRDRDCARMGQRTEPAAWAPVRARCLAAFSDDRTAVLRARLRALGG